MPRRKKKKITKNPPLRVKLFAAFLVVVVLAGIGMVKLFQTTHGRIILLDAGFTDYYDTVQQELEAELRRVELERDVLKKALSIFSRSG